MVEVGIRELKANLSRYLRQVEAGEQIRITVRGRPVADVLPVGEDRVDPGMRALAAAGKVRLPSQSWPASRPPRARGEGSASELILAEREDDR